MTSPMDAYERDAARRYALWCEDHQDTQLDKEQELVLHEELEALHGNYATATV